MDIPILKATHGGSAGAPPLTVTRLSFGGYRTRALMRPGTGATVLCLHGFADSADGFRTLFDTLRNSRHNLVALDLPGFGEGPPLAPRPVRALPQLVAFACAAIAHFSPDDREAAAPLLLLGHSLGGRTALAAAARSDRPLAGVIALAPAPLRLSAPLRLLAAEQRLLPRAARLLQHLPDEFLRRCYLSGFRRTFHAPDAADPEVFRRRMAGRDAKQVAREAEGLLRIGSEIDDPVDLSQLGVPVDLVWGADDRLIPPSVAKGWRARITHARYHELERCGHEIAQERADFVAMLIGQSSRLE